MQERTHLRNLPLVLPLHFFAHGPIDLRRAMRHLTFLPKSLGHSVHSVQSYEARDWKACEIDARRESTSAE